MLRGTPNRGDVARDQEPVFPTGVAGASYTLIRPLASGGMGRVELVARRDGAFFRLFARKRLRADLVDDPEVRRMFLDEARIAGLVSHPNVVSVVDVGEDDGGPFLVMEFVEGVALSQLMARASARGERMPVDVCLRIAAQTAEALHALHALHGPDGTPLELVHRDVSPPNILVGFDGTARLTDFGIAKALGRAARTTTGVLKGKLGYMAPEQLRFEDPDHRSDLFALGVVLFEMLAGRRLYENAREMEGPRRILNEPPPDLADDRDDVEPELVELLFEMLAKEREHRPADARLVARRLEQLLAAERATRDGGDTASYVERLFSEERRTLRLDVAEIARRGPIAVVAAVRSEGSARARSGLARRAPLAWLLGGAALIAAAAGGMTFAIGHRAEPRAARGAAALVAAAETAPASATPVASHAPAAAPDEAAAVGATPEGSRSPAPGATTAAATAPFKKQRATRLVSAPSGRIDCTPPYTVDEDGHRHFKIPCLVDVRR